MSDFPVLASPWPRVDCMQPGLCNHGYLPPCELQAMAYAGKSIGYFCRRRGVA